MITYPTVLVLGAGVSYPYGFPLGFELRELICSSKFSTDIRRCFSFELLDGFIRAFYQSHINSIDSFLSRRSEYTEIGKVVIASIISQAELPNNIHTDKIDDNSYKYIWNRISEDVSHIQDLSKNQIKIITFNYDRSLEYYLFTSIKNSFGVDEKDAFEAMKHIPIVHFYGSLGKLSLNYGDDCLPYYENHPTDIIFKSANNIRIMHEDRDENINTDIFNEWFLKARNIVFIGFGFDSLNLSRLGLKDLLEKNFSPHVFDKRIIASTFGLTESEAIIAGRKTVGKDFMEFWSSTNSKTTDTLRHYASKLI